MRIVFPFLAQPHQVPHSLPIAVEIARRFPGSDVRLASPSDRIDAFVRHLLAAYAPDATLRLDRLRLDPVSRALDRRGHVPWKQGALLVNRDYFRDCDAIVTPERTSLFLRRIGVTAPRLIWTRHGAGDREVGFAANVREFDFVLMAGRRIERRLLARGLIRPGAYATGVYAKFDWVRSGAAPTRLFDNDRPTVLYNPHFAPGLSSWHHLGLQVLDQFAASGRYNLVFAPHVRLFEAAGDAVARRFARFDRLPHVRIDLGSRRSVDMTYTRAADLYLGDVSSQVAEFLHRPRPCVFLDAHGRAWRGDPSFAFWSLGPVLTSVEGLEHRIDEAFAGHSRFASAQRDYFQETFELPPGRASARDGAEAIVAFLKRSRAVPSAAASSVVLPHGR